MNLNLKIYDSLTQKEVLLNKTSISIYNCGPTVYNHIHIGNARPLITMDILYRYLEFRNIEVKYYLNITDIDDKIINKAIELNQKEQEVSEYYYKEYLKLFDLLNIKKMNIVKVSDHIDDIILYIQKILINDYAYLKDGDVYFRTNKVKNYGEVSKNNLDSLYKDTRIINKENKENNYDFVLWKQTNVGINWQTNWSLGRPGWHTECSCLINKYIGDQVDIHGGGIDLKFPHHENENAQNYAINNKKLANVWMHFGMINIDNKKMSKSLNNFILIKDILKEFDYRTLKWFFYQTKFNNPLNYSKNNMQEAKKHINKINLFINKLKTNFILKDIEIKEHDLLSDKFILEMENNLNLPNVITLIDEKIKLINKYNFVTDTNEIVKNFFYLINELKILGIEFEDIHNDENLKLINKYKKLLAQKDFNNSDKLRQELMTKGLL